MNTKVYRRIITLLTVALITVSVLLVATMSQVKAATTGCTTEARNGTVVIGDSLTAGPASIYAQLTPSWDIDGVAGRKVEDLPALARKWECRTRPRNFVLALGTNPSSTWGPTSYQEVVDSLPPGTKAFIPTVVRDGNEFPTMVATMQQYNVWIRDTTNVTVIPWAERITQGAVRLPDGVHPDAAGREYRVKLIRNWVNRISPPLKQPYGGCKEAARYPGTPGWWDCVQLGLINPKGPKAPIRLHTIK
jgi:hypothetical protein